MIDSMTGYGKGEAQAGNVALTVEIKTVNHRYADITVKLPRTLLAFENDIRRQVSQVLRRGKIDVFVNFGQAEESSVVPVLNRPLALAYRDLYTHLRNELGLFGEVSIEMIAAQKDVIQLRETESTQEELGGILFEALDRALAQVAVMRRKEGEATAGDLQDRLTHLETFLEHVEQRAPLIPQEWQAKLMERLARLQQNFEWDPQRVAQEVAIYADRCDISEELARFRSHLGQFRGLFDDGEPVGRRMDFLVQELNREVNTMGSKSNDADLTRTVVAMKAELEKIREQVQNIE
ncbi:MAG: YicC family protein [Deltaproteobacteria bacterium]|nr:MAG: YicC family protein [Deltaproteobacteria bacterium]